MLFITPSHLHSIRNSIQKTKTHNSPINRSKLYYLERRSALNQSKHVSHNGISEHVTYIQLMLGMPCWNFCQCCRGDSNYNLTSDAWESCPHFCLRRGGGGGGGGGGGLPPCAPACACSSLEVSGVTASIKSTSLLFSGNASVWPQQQPRYCSGNVSKELLRRWSEAKATNHAQTHSTSMEKNQCWNHTSPYVLCTESKKKKKSMKQNERL